MDTKIKIFIEMLEKELRVNQRQIDKAKEFDNYGKLVTLDGYKSGLETALAFFKQVFDIDGVIESKPLPEEKSKKEMKKGKYYIGDPCYIFDKSWEKILNSTNYLSDGYCEINKFKCFTASTAYGDGKYKDNKGFIYPVDAGLIGILPVELLKLDNRLTEEVITEEQYGRIVEMKKDFDCSCDNGIFEFGDITINTRGCEEEEE